MLSFIAERIRFVIVVGVLIGVVGLFAKLLSGS